MPVPSLLLIHGPASGAWIWDAWRRHLREAGWQVNVLDLRGHGRSLPADLSMVTMEDYVADIASVTVQIERAQGVHPIIGGWSMGGMLAMMYASQHPETTGLLLIEPSMPFEVAGRADAVTQRRFTGPALTPEAFGIFPDSPERSQEALFDLTDREMSNVLENSKGAEESGIAFRQVLRGISIAAGSITCPALVLYGDADARSEVRDRSLALAAHVGGTSIPVSGAGHWGIVCHDQAVADALPGVATWLRRITEQEIQ